MKLEEIIGFRQAVEEIVPKGSPQYETICAAFDRLSEVAYQPGHGITLIIKLTEDHYRFERPDREITADVNVRSPSAADYLIRTRGIDKAKVIGSDGRLTHQKVSLPVFTDDLIDEYGITDLEGFMGYEPSEDGPGSRSEAVWCATTRYENIVAVNLHEVSSGAKQEVALWFRGQRKYSNKRGPLNYEFVNTPADTGAKVLPFRLPAVAETPYVEQTPAEQELSAQAAGM